MRKHRQNQDTYDYMYDHDTDYDLDVDLDDYNDGSLDSLLAKLDTIEKEAEKPKWWDKNLELEANMKLNGALICESHQQQASDQGRLDVTATGLMKHYLNAVATKIKEYKEGARKKTLIYSIDEKVLAVLAISECINHIGIPSDKKKTLTSPSIRIGQALEDYLHEEWLKGREARKKELMKQREKKLQTHRESSPRFGKRNTLAGIQAILDREYPDWTPVSRESHLRDGYILIHLTCEACEGLDIENEVRMKEGKWVFTKRLVVTDEYRDRLLTILKAQRLNTIQNRPMVVPPKDWEAPLATNTSVGGYHTIRNNISSNSTHVTNSTHSKEKAGKFYDAINLVQSTEYAINTAMLDVLIADQELGAKEDEQDEIICKPADDADKKEWSTYYRERDRVDKKRQSDLSKQLGDHNTVMTAIQYAGRTSRQHKQELIRSARARKELKENK